VENYEKSVTRARSAEVENFCVAAPLRARSAEVLYIIWAGFWLWMLTSDPTSEPGLQKPPNFLKMRDWASPQTLRSHFGPGRSRSGSPGFTSFEAFEAFEVFEAFELSRRDPTIFKHISRTLPKYPN
jgi:hypothetical protein